MRTSSPPVTRQRAQVLFLEQAPEAEKQEETRRQQQQQHQEHARRGNSGSSGGRVRSRKQQEQQRQERHQRYQQRQRRFAQELKGGSRRRGKEENERVATGGIVGCSSRTAHPTPTSVTVLGNSLNRCRRGKGRSNSEAVEEGRVGGSGGGDGSSKVAVAVTSSGPGDVGEEGVSGGCGKGGTHGDDGVPLSSASLSLSSLAGEAAVVTGTAAVASAAAAAAVSDKDDSTQNITSTSQPLEEVNPSVPNMSGLSLSECGGASSAGHGDDGSEGSVSREAALSEAAVEGEKLGVSGDGDVGNSAAGSAAMVTPSEHHGAEDNGGGDGISSEGSKLPIPPARGADTPSGMDGVVVEREDEGVADTKRSGAASVAGVAEGIEAAEARSIVDAGVGSVPERGVKPPAAGGAVDGDEPGRQGSSSRVNGKSVKAQGSTGVSPMQKRNRRELKLSEEETAMAGAPQGPVYQVVVLETGDFEASTHAEEEMRAVRAASGGQGDWADLYSAVDSARRLCIFHAEVVLRDGEEGNLDSLVGLLATGVGNLRSSTVRNALLGVRDAFSFLKHDLGRVDIRPLIAATLQRLAGGDKRFICQTAAQAMEVAARDGPGVAVLHAILPSLDDRNAEVASKSALYSERCLASLGVGSKAGVSLPEGMEFHSMIRGMSRALNGKAAEGRASARRALLRSRKAMGLLPFEAEVKASLEKSETFALLAALATPSRGGAAGEGKDGSGRAPGSRGRGAAVRGVRGGAPRQSIRAQMMAARRKKEEEAKGGAGGGSAEEFVIVT